MDNTLEQKETKLKLAQRLFEELLVKSQDADKDVRDELENDLADVEKKLKEIEKEKNYARVWTNDSNPDGKTINERVVKSYLECPEKNDYSLLIVREETLTLVYKNGKRCPPPPGKAAYRILVFALKHKGNCGTAWNLAKYLWDVREVEKFRDLREISKAMKEQSRLKIALQEFEAKPGDNVEYYSNRVRRSINPLNSKFLSQFNTELKANAMDEFELSPLINYCLVEIH